MTPSRLAAVMLLAFGLGACGDHQGAVRPQPLEPGPDAIGTICRMSLSEHAGPKGQVFLNGQPRPLWFSSVRDTFAWMLVDGGSTQGIAAIWVNDMARSKTWDRPDAGAWVEARQATYVVGSNRGADMGGGELVPFSDPAAAVQFASRHGGRTLGFRDITHETLAEPASTPAGHGDHRHD